MILDSVENIENYKNSSKDFYEGITFIKNATPEIPLGTVKINENTTAFITEYFTKEHFEPGFEIHRKFIDIQYPIKGLELIKWAPKNVLKIKNKYDDKKDVEYYQDHKNLAQPIVVGNKIFTIMFPEDGHAPQHFVNEIELIKKITIKIKVTNENSSSYTRTRR